METDVNPSIPIGVIAEITVQIISQIDERPCLRILKRTRRNTTVIGTWKSSGPSFQVDQVDDVMSFFHREVMEEMILSRGVQLALRLDER